MCRADTVQGAALPVPLCRNAYRSIRMFHHLLLKFDCVWHRGSTPLRCMHVQTACGLRNGFEFTVQLQMETTAIKLVLHASDQRLVHCGDQGTQPLRKAHFDWVTEAGSKEHQIVVRCWHLAG